MFTMICVNLSSDALAVMISVRIEGSRDILRVLDKVLET